jgi:hypothetical protein
MKAWKLAPLAAALTSATAFAVEPVGMGLGNGLTLLPSVDVNVENNDNVYLQADGNEVESTITRIAPALSLIGDMGAIQWNANYRAEQGTYSKDEDDDYLDQNINVAAGFEVNARNQIDVNAAFNSAHDARGAGALEGAAALDVLAEPDQYEETTAGVQYTFGADSAFANIVASADTYQKRYDDNKQQDGSTIDNSERDYDKVTALVGAQLNLSPATKAVFEISQASISYDASDDDAREGDNLKILAGMSWDITGKTTGEVKLGSATRDFKNSDEDSTTRLSWSANLTWEPMTYSSVALYSAQSNNETATVGNYIANTYTQVSWDHSFSTFVSAGIEASRSADTYVGASREDETISYGLNVTYSPKAWMDVKASFNQADRDSTNNDLDYDGQVVNLGITLAL